MKFVLMKSFGSVLLLTALALPMWVTASEKQAHDEPAKWSYKGATGPVHWGDLSAEYTMCKQGKNQSPVNIIKAIDGRLPSIKFDYKMLVAENIINNGHTIQVNIRKGGLIKLDGKDFFLKQFHFHTPSENRIDGMNFPLEAHFVHASEDNELAVVALLYQPGVANAALDVLLKNMPMKAGDKNRLGSKDIELFERSKKISNYFRFDGSLTTPPCTEGVRWIVSRTMSTISRRQLDKFQQALKHPNNRPVQPLNARMIIK